MKLALALIFFFSCNLCALAQSSQNNSVPNKNLSTPKGKMEQQLQLMHQRQLELMKKLTQGLKSDQMHMNKLFDDQFFKQADQMFKQIQDQGSPFGQIIQQFQKGLSDDFDNTEVPSQWRESNKGMAFVLPYILGPKDKVDLKINKNQVSLEIQRWQNSGLSSSQSYQFPIPTGCDPAGMEMVNDDKKGETHILFPWKKKLQKVPLSKSDNVI